MANADRNNLHRSGLEDKRQQRQEQPQVPGASGSEDDTSAETANVKARKSEGRRRSIPARTSRQSSPWADSSL